MDSTVFELASHACEIAVTVSEREKWWRKY